MLRWVREVLHTFLSHDVSNCFSIGNLDFPFEDFHDAQFSQRCDFEAERVRSDYNVLNSKTIYLSRMHCTNKRFSYILSLTISKWSVVWVKEGESKFWCRSDTEIEFTQVEVCRLFSNAYINREPMTQSTTANKIKLKFLEVHQATDRRRMGRPLRILHF